MSFKFRLLVFFLSCGVVVPSFARSRDGLLREHRAKIKEFNSQKLPLSKLLARLDAAQKKQESKEVLNVCEKICRDYPETMIAAETYFRMGMIYEESRQFSKAIEVFTKVVKHYPSSPWFAAAVEKYFTIAEKLQSGVRPYYFGVVPGLRDYNSAVQNYELVVKYAPYSKYAPKALMEIANLHMRAKHYEMAIDALDRLIDLYPDSVEVADAYLKTAEIYSGLVKGEEYNQGGALAARRCYQEFRLIFPDHLQVSFAEDKIRELNESIVKSKISLGDFYFNAHHNTKAAKMLYRLAIDFAPYAAAADVARTRIEEIDNGKKPKSTPVDFIFSKIGAEPNDEFVNAAKASDRVMDQKECRVDSIEEKSETPFVTSIDIHADGAERDCCE